VAHAAADKKAHDPVLIEVGDVLAITDVFVVTSGANDRQVRTICEEIERRVREATGRGPLHTEGWEDASWVLLDYGDVVVHVMLDDTRAYYSLERLWGDMPRVAWDGDAAASAAPPAPSPPRPGTGAPGGP